MSHVWALLEQWSDGQKIRPTQAQLARLLGVTRGTVTNWKQGTVPKPEQVDAIVRGTGLSKQTVLTAVLRDQGYLRVEEWGASGDAAATSRAEVSSAQQDDYRLAAHPTRGKQSRGRQQRREHDALGEGTQETGDGE